jgi:hypothetical protein
VENDNKGFLFLAVKETPSTAAVIKTEEVCTNSRREHCGMMQ